MNMNGDSEAHARFSPSVDRAASREMARLAGACWLGTILTGFLALILGSRFLATSDAAQMASLFAEQADRYRLSLFANLVATLFYVGATVFVYYLLRPAREVLAAAATAFSLVGCAVGAASGLLGVAPLVLLRGSDYLSVLPVEQLHALVIACLRLQASSGGMALVFFGFHCLLVGLALFGARMVPRWVSGLLMVGGVGWLSNLWPPLASSLGPFGVLPGLIGESALVVWLLLKGVNTKGPASPQPDDRDADE